MSPGSALAILEAEDVTRTTGTKDKPVFDMIDREGLMTRKTLVTSQRTVFWNQPSLRTTVRAAGLIQAHKHSVPVPHRHYFQSYLLVASCVMTHDGLLAYQPE